MIKFIEFLGAFYLYIGLLLIYAFIGFIIFMIIQLISYRIFKFNLYKFIKYYLIEKWI